jgi:glycosyltransferase involved in cell wall biosynthesis
MTPELSVVIPTRNRWPLLRRALDSALAQRDVALEVIVVDDGSTDGSAERAQTTALTDPRVSVARRPHAGVAAARNHGIERARAPWIALLDDDDLWSPEKARRQLDALASAGAEIACTGQIVVDELLRFKRLLEAPDPDHLLSALIGSNVIGTPSSVIARRDALTAVGGFDARFSVLADWDMWLRLCQGRRATACPQTLVAYVEHDTNLHMVDTDSMLAEFAMLVDRHAGLTTASGEALGDIHWSRWIASSYRRAGRRGAASLAYFNTGRRFHSGRDLLRAVAILGGERVMRRLAQPTPRPDAGRRAERAWLPERV